MTVATLTSGAGVSYLAGDQQGTSTVAISASSLTVTRRYYDPYGNPIGTPATGFPDGERGFIGGADDPATGLTDLGARELQPGTGSFISTDPVQNSYDPQDLNPYAYASDNPATESDPTGAAPAICDASGCTSTILDAVTAEEVYQTSLTAGSGAMSVTCQQALQKKGDTADAVAVCAAASAPASAGSSPPPPCPAGCYGVYPSTSYIIYSQPDTNTRIGSCNIGAHSTNLGTVKIQPYTYETGNQNGTFNDPQTWGMGNTSVSYYADDDYAFGEADIWKECLAGQWTEVYYGEDPIIRTVTGFFPGLGDDDGSDTGAPSFLCTGWSNYNWEPEQQNQSLQQPAQPNKGIIYPWNLARAAVWPFNDCSGSRGISTGPPVIVSSG
jgi:RHS repeat-associated protein